MPRDKLFELDERLAEFLLDTLTLAVFFFCSVIFRSRPYGAVPVG
jgi:hypothetical protein